MDRYAIIRDGKVENVCLWDGDIETWQPPEGSEVVPDDGTAETGGTYANGVFSPPVPESARVPETVTNRQLRLVLIGVGKFNDADGYIRTLGLAAVTEWDYANDFARHHPLVEAAGSAFGMTEGQVDDLFRQAATL